MITALGGTWLPSRPGVAELAPQALRPEDELQLEAAVRVVDLVAPQFPYLAQAVADGLGVDAETGRDLRGATARFQPCEQGLGEAAAVGGAAVGERGEAAQGEVVDEFLGLEEDQGLGVFRAVQDLAGGEQAPFHEAYGGLRPAQ